MSITGRLIGVGVGPGDPELLTVKAVRVLEQADVIAYFAKAGNESNARQIVSAFLRRNATELPLLYPVTTEVARQEVDYQAAIQSFFDAAASSIAAYLEAGRIVAVLSEGDPLFYGSYMHVHIRLHRKFPTQVVPGITAMSGCWSAAGLPISQGDDVLSVLPGTLAIDQLVERLRRNEPAVIMKVGRNFPKVRQALTEVDRLAAALYVERGTMQNGQIVPLAQKLDDSAPYFSIVLVPGPWGQA